MTLTQVILDLLRVITQALMGSLTGSALERLSGFPSSVFPSQGSRSVDMGSGLRMERSGEKVSWKLP